MSASLKTEELGPCITNIRREPIAEGGFRRCQRLIGKKIWRDKNPSWMLEVLIETKRGPTLYADLTLNSAIKVDLVHDAGGSSWCILGMIGPKAAIQRAIEIAEAAGAKLLPEQ